MKKVTSATSPVKVVHAEVKKIAVDGAGRVCGFYVNGVYEPLWDRNDPYYDLYGPNTY